MTGRDVLKQIQEYKERVKHRWNYSSIVKPYFDEIKHPSIESLGVNILHEGAGISYVITMTHDGLTVLYVSSDYPLLTEDNFPQWLSVSADFLRTCDLTRVKQFFTIIDPLSCRSMHTTRLTPVTFNYTLDFLDACKRKGIEKIESYLTSNELEKWTTSVNKLLTMLKGSDRYFQYYSDGCKFLVHEHDNFAYTGCKIWDISDRGFILTLKALGLYDEILTEIEGGILALT